MTSCKLQDAFASHIITYIRRRLPTSIMSANVLPHDTMKVLLHAVSKATCMSSASVNDLSSLCVQISEVQRVGFRIFFHAFFMPFCVYANEKRITVPVPAVCLTVCSFLSLS